MNPLPITHHLEMPISIDPAWLPAWSVEELQARHHITVSFSPGEKKTLRRKKKIRASVWAERHIVLPDDSPRPGPWKNITARYLAGIMDASFYPSVEEIIVCAAPQVGKSQCVANCIGYVADRVPGNVLFVFPDEKEAGTYSKDRIQPMLVDSPRLRSYLTGEADDLATMRIKLQHLKIYFAWATSAARLSQRPLPYGVIDEEDKNPATVGKKESGPTELVRKRMRNFPGKRKLWRLSSPTIEGVGISKGLNEDAEVIFDYWVKCPDCKDLHKMDFKQIKWPGGSDADPKTVLREGTAYYECPDCGAVWDDLTRDMAVRKGEYRAREENRPAKEPAGKKEEIGKRKEDSRPSDIPTLSPSLSLENYLAAHNPRVIGFHVPAWLSPFVTLSECAAAFLKGIQDKSPAKTALKDFQNGYAAKPWKVYQKERSEDRILLLRDDRPRGRVPSGNVVAGLVAGVDTQDYGFWYRIRAFGYGGEALVKESWGIREGYVTTFEALEQVLWTDTYMDAEGNRYVVNLVIQDALGHRTSEVYKFCIKNRGRVFPSFGRDKMAQQYTWTNLEYFPGTKKPIPGGLKGINVNTKYFKDELAGLLEVAPSDPGAWHENSEFSFDWARHMTAEFVNEKGIWECPDGKDNHIWDCAVLCLAAHEILGMMFWPAPGSRKEDIGKRKEKREKGAKTRW